MKAKEVLQITGIRRETLSRLVKQGVIHVEKGTTGQYSNPKSYVTFSS